MTHMVIFQSTEGNPGYHQTESLDDAVRFVEGLRNDQNVDQARIFRMEEIPFEFRPYFRVELGKGASALKVRGFALADEDPIDLTAALADEPPADEAEETDEAAEPEPPADVEDEPVTQFERDPAPEPVSTGFVGRRGLFGR